MCWRGGSCGRLGGPTSIGVLGVHDLATRGASGNGRADGLAPEITKRHGAADAPIWGQPGEAGRGLPLAEAIGRAPQDAGWRRPAVQPSGGVAGEALPLQMLQQEAQELAAVAPAEIISSTEAVVVVKGAGGQGQDDTLSEFVRGFWVAVNADDPRATMSIQPREELTGALATIQTGNQRIWVKEAYWEPALKASSALRALWLEWQSATYAYASMVNNLVGVPDPEALRDEAGQTRWIQYAKSVLSMVILYTWLLLFLLFVLYFDRMRSEPEYMNLPGINEEVLTGWLTRHFALLDALPDRYVIFVALCVALFVIAIVRAFRAAWVLGDLRKQKPLRRFTSEVLLIYVIALAAIVLSPIVYLVGITLLIMSQVALLIARDVFWACRPDFNSDDLPLPREAPGSTPRRGIRKTWQTIAARYSSYMLSPVLYRFTVVLVLPLVSVLLLLTRVLHLIPSSTPIIGGWASSLERFLASMVSGNMGDVSIYAADPPVASRVQSVIQTDLRWFHERHDVAHIHVFAHSQGTPITYETLFRHLPDRYCRKIRTYVTIGSVLNYYHQANPVLDALYYDRFPIADDAIALREAAFSPGFRWINCWNRSDPITEFFGIIDFHDGHPSRPTNVITPGHWFPSTSHSEYWQNLGEVQGPLVRRVRGLPSGDAWTYNDQWDDHRSVVRGLDKSFQTHRAVMSVWLLGVAIFAAIAVSLIPLASALYLQMPNVMTFIRRVFSAAGVTDASVADQATGFVSAKLIYLLLLLVVLLAATFCRNGIVALLRRLLVVDPEDGEVGATVPERSVAST